MTKPPKAAIIKAHKLADDLLALWQADIRTWCEDGGDDYNEQVARMTTDNILKVVNTLRVLRQEVEAPDA